MDGNTAVISWAAFECSSYADMAGKGEAETKRLFEVGSRNGRAFVEAARSGSLAQSELDKTPVGILSVLSSPTTDFALGRIFQTTKTQAYDFIVKKDSQGLPLPIDKWKSDPKLQKILADNEYARGNCSILR